MDKNNFELSECFNFKSIIEGDAKKGHTHFGPLFLILDQSFTLNGQNNLLRALKWGILCFRGYSKTSKMTASKVTDLAKWLLVIGYHFS